MADDMKPEETADSQQNTNDSAVESHEIQAGIGPDDGGTPPERGLSIVGIAASAGGLEATSLLVQNLAASVHAAYVIAQHMSPTHKSLLTSLISRETKLPVIELHDTMVPEPGKIYVTPPNSDVIMREGALTLTEPFGHPATPKPSADRLFKSLADECGELAVGIVLSGTGSDGSYGVQAIREAGGVTIAQDVDSAKYDSMPSSAIATGCVDLTLTPERIGQQFERIIGRPRDFGDLRIISQQPSRLADLLQVLLARTGVDFRGYKESTVNRRIARRMNTLSIDTYAEYVDYCRTSQDEVDALYKDLLISVTRFFRDPRQFDQLKTQIDQLVEGEGRRQLRVWVTGCATGEEAYTIAILFAEALGGPKALKKSQVQIFATDIDDRALDVARRGVYPISAAQDVPTHLITRYFEMTGNELRVIRELRDVTLFSRHNIFQDPPFINLDLVSIRNLLIYFEPALQERVLYRIHYALAPAGLLFLGTSETIGSMEAHFEARAGTEKIFGKRRTSRMTNYRFPDLASGMHRQGSASELQESKGSSKRDSEPDVMFDSLVKAVAPNGFIATRSGDIVRVIGDISPFIALDEHGPLSMTTRLLRKPLRDEVISLMAISLKTWRQRTSRWHEFALPDANRVQFQCFPLSSSSGSQDNCLIAIHTKQEDPRVPERSAMDGEERAYIERMEQDMRSTQEALQQTVEELQTTNEELQSVNEEMQSTNEELQATNEELETSNEELQSANEELITVNEELQINSAELQAVLADLDAILKDVPFVVLAVDTALMVRRASDMAREFFKIGEIPATGLHLSQLAIPEGFPNLSKPAAEVFNLRQPKEFLVDSDNSNYRLAFAPYADAKMDLSGLTISVLDREMASIREVGQLMHTLSGRAHWRYNIHSGQLTWSDEIFRLHGRLPEKDSVPPLDEVIGEYHSEDRETLRSAMDRAISHGDSFSLEARLAVPGQPVRYMRVEGSVLQDGQGEPAYVLGTLSDIGSAIDSQMMLESLSDLRDTVQIGVYSIDLANDAAQWSGRLCGTPHEPGNAPQKTADWLELVQAKDRSELQKLLKQTSREGKTFDTLIHLTNPEDARGEVRCVGRARRTPDGHVTHVYGSFRLNDD